MPSDKLGSQDTPEEVKEAEGIMDKSHRKATQERIQRFEKNSIEGFEILLSEITTEGLRLKNIELSRLDDHTELRDYLLGEIKMRDEFILTYADGTIVTCRNHWYKQFTDRKAPEPEFIIMTAAQHEEVRRLYEQLDSLRNDDSRIKEAREIYFRIKKLEAETNRAEEETTFPEGEILEAQGYTGSGRSIIISGDTASLDFGQDGSEDFAKHLMLGKYFPPYKYGEEEDPTALTGPNRQKKERDAFRQHAEKLKLDRSLRAFKVLHPDEGDSRALHSRTWVNFQQGGLKLEFK
ncbi:MAG: hypothetical protein Q8O46_02335 [bacterium]|nr:hypothetical protein [bacterium]